MATVDIDLNNLSDNPEDLAAVFAQLEAGETPAIKEPDPPAAQTADEKSNIVPADSDQQSKEQEQAQPDQQAEPEGVATKDGKHVIPYSVLKSERDRASRAETLAQQMGERIAALEALIQGGESRGEQW